MRREQTTVRGWGGSSQAALTAITPASIDELSAAPLPHGPTIARGLGRSYGDAAQRAGGIAVIGTECDDAIWVDRSAGVLRVGAGATIGGLIDRFAPKGWFVPVSPGTRRVTVGGAIAADIHGKNHHADGSFGNHVRSLRLRLADDSVIQASPTEHADVFWATIGGMGLTGIVVDADIAMVSIPTSKVRVETQRLDSLDELMKEMRASDHTHDFSVAWVDLIGRGRSVLTQGSFATAEELDVDPPGRLARPPSPSIGLPRVPIPRLVHTPLMRVFNELWYRRAPAELSVTHESITAFWHPLDAVADWNRLYGSTGFFQWQCAVPDEHDDLFREICARLGEDSSYLTVLKRFGPGNEAPLSFPRSGWTIAVDLPATRRVRRFLDELDKLLLRADGRLYLAKDARQSRETFEAGYERLDEWKSVRRAVDPNRRWQSDLSERLGL